MYLNFNRSFYICNIILIPEKVVQTSLIEGKMNVFNQPCNASSKIGKMGEADGHSQSSEEGLASKGQDVGKL